MALLLILRHQYIDGVTLILLSIVMDGFDGTIARITKTESAFGMHLDSLVDGVTFGMVPAVLIYLWGYQAEFSQMGKVIAFVFLSAGIIRLARFNILKEAGAYSANIFIGLPIPMGAISIVSVVLFFQRPLHHYLGVIAFSLFVILVSLLMISNIKYRTLKKIHSRYNLLILFILAFLVAFVIMYKLVVIPLIALGYLVSPLFFYISAKIRKRRRRTKSES